MGILKTGLKILGSTALGAAGVASTVLRACASGAGMDELADGLGNLQNKSFETIRDMWTPEEEKTDEYYQQQIEREEQRAEKAARLGADFQKKVERMREQNEDKK